MLTAIPTRWLHRLRDTAAALLLLAELALELACPCEDGHDGALAALEGRAA